MKKIFDQNQKSLFLNMPTEVLLGISDQLDLLDCAALALTCKDVAKKLDAYNYLDWDGPNDYELKHPRPENLLLDFFGKKLTDGWVPSSLKYCGTCGKFRPRDDREYWFDKFEKAHRGKRGGTSQFIEREFLSAPEWPYSASLKNVCYAWQSLDSSTCPQCQGILASLRAWGNVTDGDHLEKDCA